MTKLPINVNMQQGVENTSLSVSNAGWSTGEPDSKVKSQEKRKTRRGKRQRSLSSRLTLTRAHLLRKLLSRHKRLQTDKRGRRSSWSSDESSLSKWSSDGSSRSLGSESRADEQCPSKKIELTTKNKHLVFVVKSIFSRRSQLLGRKTERFQCNDESNKINAAKLPMQGEHAKVTTLPTSSLFPYEAHRNSANPPRWISCRQSPLSCSSVEEGIYFDEMEKSLSLAEKGESDERGRVSAMELKIVDGAVACAVVSSAITLALSVPRPLSCLASVLTMTIAPYVSHQARRLKGTSGYRARNERLRAEIEYLQTANTHLRATSVGTQAIIRRRQLESTKSIHEYINNSKKCSEMQCRDVIVMAKKLGPTIEAAKQRLKDEILLTFTKTVLVSNRDSKFVLNPLGIEILVERLKRIPFVTFHPDRFRKKVASAGYSTKAVMSILRDVIEDSVDPQHKIFTFPLLDSSKANVLTKTVSCHSA